MRQKVYAILVCIGLIIFLFSVTSAQKSSSQLKNNKKKIEQDILQTQKLLNETKKNKNATLQQAALLRKQIANRENLIYEINNELYEMELELDANEETIKELDKKLEYMKTDYSRIVYMAYKNRRSTDKLTFLLSAKNFNQMYQRIKYYTLFSLKVKDQVQEIEQVQNEIKQSNNELTAIKEGKVVLLDGKEKELRQLEIDRKAKNATANQLKKKENQLANELKKKEKKRRELDLAIKKAIEQEIMAANAKRNADKSGSNKNSGSSKGTSTEILLTPEEKIISTNFQNNKGLLPWPVAKGRTIVEYGKRPHPDVPSVTIDNKGIDILVEANEPVRAVFNGVVTATLDLMGSKVVMIRHGEYITVYQNLATVTVKKGDHVKSKQNIGTVAKASGSSTYELHFEVWKNKVNLNPSSWIASR